ncbi:MAG: hypothetical protein II963_02285 [Bacteroidales bacterium]|nr:hypothetical protein [Bacteroidales bacterium]MBQ6081497.1 hypothetical protein [Bacteroidales bacterium]MBQ9529691.1 hypothetical protein [Bacteroidales bacterium]
MKNVDITISVAEDGFYSAYCNDYPALFGSGDTPESAIDELRETLKITKELGRDSALFYPEWIDDEYVFLTHWNISDLMSYYAGVITPSALGRLANIHPKQVWSYLHGRSKPRKAQIMKMQSALHKLGQELINTVLL